MLLIKILKKLTPKLRFQVRYKAVHSGSNNSNEKYFFKYVANNNKLIHGNKGISNIRFYAKRELRAISYSYYNNCLMYIHNISSFKNSCKEYSITKNIYNFILRLPAVSLHIPGFKLYPFQVIKESEGIKRLIGQCVPIIYIPINMLVSNLYNTNNIYSAYIRSSGSQGIRRRLNKVDKLVHIELPSGKIKYFSIITLGVFSGTYNLFKNKLIEGGWGYFIKNKKHINVRGVAKNPVDHPNGGRTKAKQPELSPWGWVAKKKKNVINKSL